MYIEDLFGKLIITSGSCLHCSVFLRFTIIILVTNWSYLRNLTTIPPTSSSKPHNHSSYLKSETSQSFILPRYFRNLTTINPTSSPKPHTHSSYLKSETSQPLILPQVIFENSQPFILPQVIFETSQPLILPRVRNLTIIHPTSSPKPHNHSSYLKSETSQPLILPQVRNLKTIHPTSSPKPHNH